MADLPFVQDDKSVEYLLGYFLRVDVRLIFRDVSAEMAVLDKLHCDVNGVSVEILKPAEKANKQLRMLMICWPDGSGLMNTSTHVLQFNHGFDLLDVPLRFGYHLHRSYLPIVCSLAPNHTKGTGAELAIGVPYRPHDLDGLY